MVTLGWQVSKVRTASTKYVYQVNFTAKSGIDGQAYGAIDVLHSADDQEVVFMAGSQPYFTTGDQNDAVEIARMQFKDNQLDCNDNMC